MLPATRLSEFIGTERDPRTILAMLRGAGLIRWYIPGPVVLLALSRRVEAADRFRDEAAIWQLAGPREMPLCGEGRVNHLLSGGIWHHLSKRGRLLARSRPDRESLGNLA